MSKTTVLLVSSSQKMRAKIEKLLYGHWKDLYEIIHLNQLEEDIPHSDICLLDEDALPENSIDFLAQSSFQLAPRPLIYIMNQEPTEASEFKTVKSLTADYLIKNQLRPSGLHNTIRYALENTSLKLELEQQQKRYSSLFYNAVEPAFFLDKELAITNVNEAFLKTFELSSSEVVNRKFESFINTKVGRDNLLFNLQESADQGLDGKFHFKTDKNEAEFLCQVRISPITESELENGILKNRIIAYHGTLRNISHKERLRAVKEKSKKIAMTYRLARTMAHEIRNPLTNVNLAVDQLKEETAEEEHLNLYYGIIERCTKRIDDILSQLLSSSEKQVFQKTKFDVIVLFKSVISEITDRASLEGVKIIPNFKIDSAQLDGDKEKLKIAFTNLFTNAIESMNKAERIITCAAYIDANYLCICVKDNGEGMDDKQLESLFDPFFTSKTSGVGLGLTSTEAIISEHHGHIDVESKKGTGSTFTIYLPLN
jgi:PAS domain S-box-containing protein